MALKTVQVAFEDLTSAVGNSSWVKEWKQLEAQALERRGEAMMIYNVSPIKGMICLLTSSNTLTAVNSAAVSQVGKRDELLSRIPSKQANEQVQWIWAGMLIELEQYVVFSPQNFNSSSCSIRCMLKSDIQKLGRNPPSEDQSRIKNRRESLQAKVEAFHQRALRFFHPDAAVPTRSSLSKASGAVGLDLEESDEEAFFLETESEWEEEEVGITIEQVMIWLPSSFTKPERVQMGLLQVAEVEAELREGQANDALEALRGGLAEKSLRFRTEVKPAKGQKTMTRAWNSIHKADEQIQGAVRCYRLARSALQALEVPHKLLSQYKEIQRQDLKMSRDIVEENRVGQRSSELPWFWRLDRKWDRDRGEFLKECKHCQFISSNLLT